ncbi:MAG: hypothetical protein IT162_22340 [Bryobacterales bacterium]|nr:hypothetical protein [Bryobacterales bacterium]
MSRHHSHFFNRREWVSTTALGIWSAAGYAQAAAPSLSLSRTQLLSGQTSEPPPVIVLRAGPVTALFEPAIAFLRYVKLGDREILRGLYAAVRDQVWGTVAPRVSNVVHEARGDSFRLTFDVDNVEGDIDFGWKGVITGAADGTVRFECNGRARSTFLRNRIGFAVLHPLRECAGKPCVIEKTGGRKENGTFPDAISPHQPYKDLAAVSHEVLPGVTAEVRFEGEVFEMEDHRNWTDGNYKTYCTPLDLPFPVEVPRGQEVKQAVTISLRGAPPAQLPGPRADAALAPRTGARPVRLPALGFGFAGAMSVSEAARLRVLRPAHVRVDLRLDEPGWEKALAAAAAIAPVEAAVFGGGDAERRALMTAAAKVRVARWLVFDTRNGKLGGAPWVVGTNEYFTELNRGRPDASKLDGSCYSLNPQVHAFDNLSLIENLEPQGETVRTARTFLGAKPVHVTPVTLKPRFNPQAKGKPEPGVPGRLPSRVDARQMSLFGAVWTLGSIKYLSEAGAASATYFQTHGWEGVMESAAGPAMPELFPPAPGAVFPLYHVLAGVAEFAGGMVLPFDSPDPLQSCALALETGPRRRLLVANLAAQPRVVLVDAAWLGARARITMLDELNAADAMRQPETFRAQPGALAEASGGRYRLAMLPYSVAKLDRV